MGDKTYNERHKTLLRVPNRMKTHSYVVMLSEAKHLGLGSVRRFFTTLRSVQNDIPLILLKVRNEKLWENR